MEDGDHPLSGRDNGLMGDDFICSTCGDESPDLRTHQIHAEICNQVKAGKFRSPLSIQELVNLRIKIEANRSDEATPPSQSRPTQVISKRTPFHGKKLFPCYKCGKEFERAGQLIAHEMKHTEEAERKRNDKIEKATDTMSIKDKQRLEKETLAKLQPFHCPFCIRKFTNAPECEKHISTHTRTFQCTFCPKNLECQSDLDRHLLSHTKEKPFKCPKCPKGFNERSSLKLHVQSVHDNYRPFQCEHCPKTIDRRHNFT